MTDTLLSRRATSRRTPKLQEFRSRPRYSRLRVWSIVKHILMLLAVVVSLYPVLWMVASSLRPESSIFRNLSFVPDSFNVANYAHGWSALGQPFSVYVWNSAVIVAGAVIGNLIACSMAAYAFARLRFRLQRPAFAVLLLTIMLPLPVVIVPQYVVWAQLHLINTFVPLIVPKFLATDGFFVFLMVQFLRGLPRELDEAARIDGAGHWRIFGQILLPLMTPALATTAIFTFLWTWNDFFGQLIYLTDPKMYTVPVALRAFIDVQGESSYGGMFAMSVISILPMLLIFTFGQKYLIRGIATTGGK